MIGTPPSFAGTPESVRDDYDVLAEMLRAVRLTGSVFLNACFSTPFGVISPKQYDETTPMAHLRHVSVFHLIAAGGCTIEIATGQRKNISAGDVLLLPFADAHKFWNGEFAEMAFGPDLIKPGPVKGMWTVNYGGGGQATRMVCGFLESSEFLFAPAACRPYWSIGQATTRSALSSHPRSGKYWGSRRRRRREASSCSAG